MSKFIIQGGKKLNGEISVSGMKSAATPIIAATLLTEDECVISNVPNIVDVRRMIEILQSLGGEVLWKDAHTLSITNKHISLKSLDQRAVKSMRSSILFLGPLLARVGEVTMSEPGGCIIGNRPLGTHLDALGALGMTYTASLGMYHFKASTLIGNRIVLPEFSVTATENILMAACLAKGDTTIKLAATEPHVQDLITFLRGMGARIDFLPDHTIRVHGTSRLQGTTHSVIPDQIEAGTFAALAAVMRSNLVIKNIVAEHLDSIVSMLQRIDVGYELGNDFLRIVPRNSLRAFRLQALPYPGFPTDLQAPFGVLATQCTGTSLIHDPLYEGRMGYISELQKMGANAVVCDPHRVLISGPTPLYGTEIKSLDLRAGATLLIAGLVAQGETVLNDSEILDRGYERIDERLNALGAEIRRVSHE